MNFTSINPSDLGTASGFSNGLLAREGGRLLFIAGQIGEGVVGELPMLTQFDEALRRVLRVVEEAGGTAEDVARMTVYVTNMELYRESRQGLGTLWRARMGSHYPTMALVEVKSLVDPMALVEIEATAVIGGR